MNTTIDTCMQQIAALTEIVATLKDDCFELNETNLQLLRQSSATNTQLALAQRAIEQLYERTTDSRIISSSFIGSATELETIEHIPFSQPAQRIPHRCNSLDGNTPLRKLRDDLETELEAKRK